MSKMRRTTALLTLSILLLSSVFVVSAASPLISNPSPVDGATNVALTASKVNLRINVSDADGDLAYISFETNKSGTWAKIADISLSGENWTTDMPVVFSNLQNGVTYWWRVKARDNVNHWTNSSSFSFKTQGSSGGGTTDNGSITIVPTQPKANRNIIFIVTKDVASGYVICQESSNVYPFQVVNKMGVVEIGTEYGEANVFVVGYGTKSFTIASPYSQGDLAIDAPSTEKINTDVQVSITANGEPISATIKFLSPTNKQMTKSSTALKPVTLSFNEAGTWQIIAQVFGTVVTGQIVIEAEQISIDVPGSASIGEEVTITTTPDATLSISANGMTWDIQADEEGNAYFTPTAVGRYKTVATTPQGKGTEYFNVKAQATIIAKNDKGFPVTIASAGDIILLTVTDANGQQISGNNVNIYGDGILVATLPLYGGSAIWHVDTAAKDYTIDFSPSDALYLPASLALTGSGGAVKWDAYYPYIAVAAIIIMVILIIVWRKGYLANLSLSGLFAKKEDDLL
jgi:hypothetical protein